MRLQHVTRYSILIYAFLLSGCATPVYYNPSYVPTALPGGFKPIPGKAFVYTQEANDRYVFKGTPSSFTGSALELSMPLGEMTREIALAAFSKVFTEGAVKGNALPDAVQYQAILEPRSYNFDHKYNALRNVGFAITPQVRMTLSVKLLSKEGRVIQEKTYDSGIKNGSTYFISFSPQEKMNKTAHVVLYDLMFMAAEDIRIAMNADALSPKK